MNYDPNMTLCGRMAKQTVNLTFQMWEYTAERTVVVGGNCTGVAVIDCAVEIVYEGLEDDRGYAYIDMKDRDGNELQSTDEGQGEDWLKDMLVKAEILSIEADT